MASLLERIRRLLKHGAKHGKTAALDTITIARTASLELRNMLFGDNMFTEAVMATLALLSVVTVIGDLVFPAGSAQAESIYMVDLAICLVLASEYAYRFANSRDRRGFLRSYWYEPLAFIPAYATAWASGGIAAILRLLRLVRVYKVFTILGRRSIYTRMMVDIIREARLAQLLVVFLLGLSFTSLLAFMAEARVPESSIQSLSDAFWWSLATVTTVGYGDVVPVTTAGRVVGVLLMLFGIAILGGFISLSSAAVVRVLGRYQALGFDRDKLDMYQRLMMLASRVHELDTGELRELVRLAAELSGHTHVDLLLFIENSIQRESPPAQPRDTQAG